MEEEFLVGSLHQKHYHLTSLPPSLPPGGHHPDHEDEEADQQRPAADRAGRDPEEHVFTTEKDDQGANRVADRPQVHKAGRDGHKHLHLHGIASARSGLLVVISGLNLMDLRTFPGLQNCK